MIFRLSALGVVTSLHDFNAADGASPNSGLVQSSDGYFYGTTFTGPGIGGTSTIFRVNAAGDFLSLHTLSSDEGQYVRAGLTEVGGFFYGISPNGGANNVGTVFKIDHEGNFTKLKDLGGNLGGGGGYAGLTLAGDGNLYTVTRGGAVGSFTILQLIVATGEVSAIHSSGTEDGSEPQGSLMLAADGNLYGRNGSGVRSTLYTIESASWPR